MLANAGDDRGVMTRTLRGGGIVVTGSFDAPGSDLRSGFLIRDGLPQIND